MVGIHAIVFYLNLLVLLPVFLEKRQYFLYFVFIIGIIIVTIVLFDLFERSTDLTDLENNMRGRGRGPRGKGHGRSLMKHFEYGRMIMNGVVVIAVLFISTIYRNISEARRREKDEAVLKNKILEAEKSFLKSQMNPHFLFNTLNNIYSLSLAKSEKTPDAIFRLSEMLRYVLYESDDKFVLLASEIKYIKAYIQLQLLKDDQIKNVNLDIENYNSQLKIAPMILIPFIELY
jgi:hypothetical protein